MRVSLILLASAGLVLWSTGVPAQNSSAPRERLAIRICAADVSARCAGIEGGQGRLRSCVKEHFKEFSQPCQARLAKLATVRQACVADIKQHCAAAKGPRRIQTCLKSSLADVSDACKEELAQAVAPVPR